MSEPGILFSWFVEQREWSPVFARVAVGGVSFFAVVIPFLFFFEWVERKLGADFQARVGPNRAGWAGILQSLADFLKLGLKSSGKPRLARNKIWFLISLWLLFSTLAFLPLGSIFQTWNPEMGFLIPVALIFAAGVASCFLAIESGTGSSWLEGIRIASQSIAASFLGFLSLLIPGLRAGGYSFAHLEAAQGASPIRWLAFRDPFLFVSFLAFLLAGCLFLGIRPLRSQEARASGFSGAKLWAFHFSREYALFFWCAMTSSLFLGGASIGSFQDFFGSAAPLAELASLLSKCFFLMFFIRWFERTSPALRAEHGASFAWRTVIPFVFLAFLGELFFMTGGALWR